MENKDKNLYRLDELTDYKIASNYADVRGWKIVDVDNRTIGKVENLWVNKEMQRVIYLDVKVDKELISDSRNEVHEAISDQNAKEFLYKDGNSHLIIPIGSVNINKDTKTVMATNIAYSTFKKTGRYNREHDFDRNYERTIMHSYYPESSASGIYDSNDDNFYRRKEFDDV
ncbi:PRC-barrel domain-containing protein [Flavobacterium agrisoli]|uniref:PRC-barrel domain-containing protein n=1 Tax=Flavobacterium agrisoli TaxID=2793066 RepID=A0A934UI57_9FLAO|nr:PRC-barrel domain-containing protein [Flavobacterium agrisoli]MBK0368264.1 PRC-barrel domain-containing protein [Flavobacterium agrisoli]